MLMKKCFNFLEKLRDFHENEKEIYQQYNILIKDIHASKNKNEITETINVLNDFDFFKKNKNDKIKKTFFFFNTNQKILITTGFSIGMMWGVVRIFEDFNSYMPFYFSFCGAFFGYLLACFIDHIQEKIDHTFRCNIFYDLEERLNTKINDFSQKPFFMKSAILVL